LYVFWPGTLTSPPKFNGRIYFKVQSNKPRLVACHDRNATGTILTMPKSVSNHVYIISKT